MQITQPLELRSVDYGYKKGVELNVAVDWIVEDFHFIDV